MKKDKIAEARSWLRQAQIEFDDAVELEKRGRF